MQLWKARTNLKAYLCDYIENSDDTTLQNIAKEILGVDDEDFQNFNSALNSDE